MRMITCNMLPGVKVTVGMIRWHGWVQTAYPTNEDKKIRFSKQNCVNESDPGNVAFELYNQAVWDWLEEWGQGCATGNTQRVKVANLSCISRLAKYPSSEYC